MEIRLRIDRILMRANSSFDRQSIKTLYC